VQVDPSDAQHSARRSGQGTSGRLAANRPHRLQDAGIAPKLVSGNSASASASASIAAPNFRRHRVLPSLRRHLTAGASRAQNNAWAGRAESGRGILRRGEGGLASRRTRPAFRLRQKPGREERPASPLDQPARRGFVQRGWAHRPRVSAEVVATPRRRPASPVHHGTAATEKAPR
jgi:hypothetical protein